MRHLVVMLKEPVAGRVKTRLGGDIGMVPAAWWFRHQAQALLRRIESPQWQTTIAVTPDYAGLGSRVWPMHLGRVPQGAGDLGARMARLSWSMPKGPVCIIGGDIPAIKPTHIKTAFHALGKSEAVFGPATDGGYWLIGLKRTRATPPSFLQNVRWSSQHALADSIASLSGLSYALIETLQDVDTAEDLRAISL